MKKFALTLLSLFVIGVTVAQQQGNHWTPITGTQYNMTVKGIIVIDGEVQANNMLEIGAFCGGECRGSRKASLFPLTGEYPVMLTVVSNVVSGETITFRIYDHATQQELDLVSESTLVFENNTNVGTMGNWFPFVFTNSSQTQTYQLSIAGYGNNTSGYNLIAPPFDDIDPATVEGMTDGDFDLYYFDQAEELEWRNYEAEHFNLASGKGYLYAHKTDVTLSFTGMPYNGNGNVTLRKASGMEFEGWNLVGNPFPQTAYIGNRNFYVMKDDGSEIIAARTSEINAMQGIFVIAERDGETLTFSTENNSGQDSKIVLSVLQGRGTPIDRAIVRFGDNGTLPKLMLNPNNTKLYISHDGTDYAVAGCGSDNTVPVSFKAKENGTYTLNIDLVHLELGYLHLVDNKTGADVDLLQTPSYTFEAHTTDYADRFSLVFASANGISEGDKPFACYADGEIRLMVEMSQGMSLQMVDMTGHIVRECGGNAARRVSIVGIPAGVYMLRLVDGNNVRTQKIVVP